MRIVYFHGFASNPLSAKGQALGRLLDDAAGDYRIPDLQGDDFTAMTMESILARAEAASQGDGPLLVIGSSLGGYVAALLAARRRLPGLIGLALVAPAFHFPDRWRERLGEAGVARWQREGSLPFFHHGAERELPLGVAFYHSCLALPGVPGEAGVPVAIVHGRADETVDWRGSLAYAQSHPQVELHLVSGDHRLGEPRHEQLIAWCARDLIARS